MLQNFPIRAQRKDDISVPRFRERLGILDSDVVLQRVVIYAAEALNDVQLLAVSMTHAVEPGLVIESDDGPPIGTCSPLAIEWTRRRIQ